MTDGTFALLEGGWYALTMFPGYLGTPYHSPFRVDRIAWEKEQQFKLEFLNLAYAAGLKNFDLEFVVVKVAPDFLACVPIDQTDRMYVFVHLTMDWMQAHFPQCANEELFDETGTPVERALLALD